MKKIILLFLIIIYSTNLSATEKNCNELDKLTKEYTKCLKDKLKNKGSETTKKIKEKSGETSDKIKKGGSKVKSKAKETLKKIGKFLKKE
tara:strand:- start:1038 stop:1307 length:270 start_codon:yes stop_codon:yes gene_type:complete